MPVAPATQEAEAGDLLEPGGARPHLKKKKKKKDTQKTIDSGCL